MANTWIVWAKGRLQELRDDVSALEEGVYPARPDLQNAMMRMAQAKQQELEELQHRYDQEVAFMKRAGIEEDTD